MRILNRPPTAPEIETCRTDFQTVEQDHRKLAEELGRRETEFAIKRPELGTAQAAIGGPQPRLPLTRKSWLHGSPKPSARKPRRPPSSRPT